MNNEKERKGKRTALRKNEDRGARCSTTRSIVENRRIYIYIYNAYAGREREREREKNARKREQKHIEQKRKRRTHVNVFSGGVLQQIRHPRLKHFFSKVKERCDDDDDDEEEEV
jgi:hypothetical protein